MLLALLLAAACARPTSAPPPNPTPTATLVPTPTSTPTPTTAPLDARTPGAFYPSAVTINGHTFALEVAVTAEERARGLSGREHLPQDRAMLFVYEWDDRWPFWMQDTLIPLDILWLAADGTVVDVQTMQPQPGVPTTLLTIYRPRAPARLVLEMNAGLAQRYGFAPGVRAHFSP